MYQVINEVPKNFDETSRGKALVCLADEYGGQSVIGRDDHCFVLYNGSNDRKFEMTYHWYPEAAKALTGFINNNPDFKL